MYSTQIHVHSASQEALQVLPELLAAALSSPDAHLHLNNVAQVENGEWVADFAGYTPAITRTDALLLLAQYPEYLEFSATYADDGGVERIVFVEAREGLRVMRQGSLGTGEFLPVNQTHEYGIACDVLDGLPEQQGLPDALGFMRSDFWTWGALRQLAPEEQLLLFGLPAETVVFTALMGATCEVEDAEFSPRFALTVMSDDGVRVNIHYNSTNLYLLFDAVNTPA